MFVLSCPVTCQDLSRTDREIENIGFAYADAMSDAIDCAEVVLFGVSQAYKESANCRECTRHLVW